MKGEESDGGEREDDIGTENWNQTGTLTSYYLLTQINFNPK
jgi:hypothetical protein